MPGYGIEEIQWNLEVHPGKMEHLNGTVEEVITQAKQLNPDFVPAKGESQQATESEPAALAKRNDIVCNKLPKGDIWKLRDGVSYLRGLSGGLTEGPGPGNCGRVSCSWKSAIWICNDVSAPNTHGSLPINLLTLLVLSRHRPPITLIAGVGSPTAPVLSWVLALRPMASTETPATLFLARTSRTEIGTSSYAMATASNDAPSQTIH